MKTKIIYILGLGRSGTTLLDIVLGNAEKALSCGELNRYPYEKGHPYQYPEDHSAFLLWNKIRVEFEARHPNVNWVRMVKLHHRFEFHGKFFLTYFGIFNRADHQEYLRFVENVIEVISDVSGHSILIDSSKYSGRALSISNSEKFDVAYLYIKRKPAAVVSSFAKKDVEQNSKSWFAANLYYFLTSMICHMAYWRLKKNHRCIMVRYEDLMNNPKSNFKRIGEQLDLDTSAIINKLDNNIPFSSGTIYFGNRVRLQKEVALRPPSAGKAGPASFWSSMINFLWY